MTPLGLLSLLVLVVCIGVAVFGKEKKEPKWLWPVGFVAMLVTVSTVTSPHL